VNIENIHKPCDKALRQNSRQPRWGGFAGYDRGFDTPPNNALLASVNLYTQRVAAFEALLQKNGCDLPKFYATAEALARRDKAARDAVLDRHGAP
jgi:predicted aminopeptidase